MNGAIGFKEYKKGFFDNPAVIARVGARKAKLLNRVGGYGRKTIRNSLKYGTKTSEPGDPPVVHRSGRYTRRKTDRKTGAETNQPASPLKEQVEYGYDERTESVVMGPTKYRGKDEAPRLLEQGGRVPGNGRVIYVTRAVGRDSRGKFVSQGKDAVVVTGMMNYRPRPFVAPGGEKAAAKFAPQLRELGG